MLSTAIGIQFDVNDISASYEIIGTSDNYSFQYKLGKGSDLVYAEGETAHKVVSLRGNYGNFKIRIFAVSDIGVRSAFVEEAISVSPPSFDDTFTFGDIRISNLPEDAKIGSTIEANPESGSNILAVDSEYVNRVVEVDWRLIPPVGHAKEGEVLGNELLSDTFLSHFSLQLRNTENGNIISSSQLDSPLNEGLQSILNTANVSAMMDHYTGFSFTLPELTFSELNLDRTLALEVISHDAFGRTATGVITGTNYIPEADEVSYSLVGSKFGLAWGHSDTDFQDVIINSVNISEDHDIYDPSNIFNSIEYYKKTNEAPDWTKHRPYFTEGDYVNYQDNIYVCTQSYDAISYVGTTPADGAPLWSELGPAVEYATQERVVSLNNTSFDQIWGRKYYYSFIPRDGYGTGYTYNLTETGLVKAGDPGSDLFPFLANVKIDNLSFIEREDDLIFRWNVTDQNGNLVDLNQYKFLVSPNDRPSILGISGSLFDSDTKEFLSGITEGFNSRSSLNNEGIQELSENLPATKIFDTFEYTREINNELYKTGGYPNYEVYRNYGNYLSGQNVVTGLSLYTAKTGSSPADYIRPSYDLWDVSNNYVYRDGLPYADVFEYNNSLYIPTGSDGQLVGPDASNISGVFNEGLNYTLGSLVIAPSINSTIYKTGTQYNIGDTVLYSGYIYKSIEDQTTQDSILPSTGSLHWLPQGIFTDVNCGIYKALQNINPSDEVLPSTGYNHWLSQNPSNYTGYVEVVPAYDFQITNYSDQQRYSEGSLVIYENNIWSGVIENGLGSANGVRTPNYADQTYWAADYGGTDFQTSHNEGDLVYSNGAVYQCLESNPTGAPLTNISNINQQIYSDYYSSQWLPFWELNTGYDNVIFKHIGIPQSGKRSVGLELGILDNEGNVLSTRSIVGFNREPSILANGFQVDSLSRTTQTTFNFRYANEDRETVTKLQLYRSSTPNFSILDSDGLPGANAPTFVSEVFDNFNSITDSPPIPFIQGQGNQITGYYYKLLPFDHFGSGDLFDLVDNQGSPELVLIYPLNYNNKNPNGYNGPVFSTTQDAIPGPVYNFHGDTAFTNYFLNWEVPHTEFFELNAGEVSSNNSRTGGFLDSIPNDVSHYEVWQSEDNYLYLGAQNRAINQDENLVGYRRITGDIESLGPIPTEEQDFASGITNATNVLNVSAMSPIIQVTHNGTTNDKRYFWIRAVDMAGNKGPFTGQANLTNENVEGLELILGQQAPTDISDFEQSITQTFPNTLALVPNNPFESNTPGAGEISWDRHFLYKSGIGFVIGPGDTSDQYVYFKGNTYAVEASRLTPEQSGHLGLEAPGQKTTLFTSAIDDLSPSVSNFVIVGSDTTDGRNIPDINAGSEYYVRFEDGLLQGQERKINTYTDLTNTIQLSVSLPFSPSNGDKIKIVKETPLSLNANNPLRNILYSGNYSTVDYHPAGEGNTNDPSANKNTDYDGRRPSVLSDGDDIIARNANGIASPMWHSFANATIGTAHIENAAITNAKIHNITADKIRSAEIIGQDIQVGGDQNSGQIRSVGFGDPVYVGGGTGYHGYGYPGAGFVISGNGSFMFKGRDFPGNPGGKLYYENGQLTIEGNIKQRDGGEFTVMSMTAEPAFFTYDERDDGAYIPSLSQSSDIVVRYNNSSINHDDVRFRMAFPNGVQIFGYDEYETDGQNNFTGYNISGFIYDPNNFDSNAKIAFASLDVGDRHDNPIKYGFDTIIHQGDNTAEHESVIIYSSGDGTSTEHSVSVGLVAQGAAGPTGRSPVYRGVWNSTSTYIGVHDAPGSPTQNLRGDVVYRTADQTYYIALETNTSHDPATYNTSNPDPTGHLWKTFGAQFESVATKLLLAEDAMITRSLTMGRGPGDDPNNPDPGDGGVIKSAGKTWADYSSPGFLLSAANDQHGNNNIQFDIGDADSHMRFSVESGVDVKSQLFTIGDSGRYIRFNANPYPGATQGRIEFNTAFVNSYSRRSDNFQAGISFTGTQNPEPEAIFIGGGYNNDITRVTTGPNQVDSLASSIVGGAHNDITGRFSFIGNGYNNSVGDNFSAIVAGYQNTMPDLSVSSDGANVIGAGYQNKIDGGSVQGVFCGAKNVIDNSDQSQSQTNFPISSGWTNVLKRGSNLAGYNYGWLHDTWINTDASFNVLRYWPTHFYCSRNLLKSEDGMATVPAWFYANHAFGWFYPEWSGSTPNIYTQLLSTDGLWVYIEIFSTTPEWVFVNHPSFVNGTFTVAFYKATSGQGLWFDPAFITNSSSLGTWEHGSGKRVFKNADNTAGSKGWYDIIVNQAGEIWYAPSYNSTPTNSKTWYKK